MGDTVRRALPLAIGIVVILSLGLPALGSDGLRLKAGNWDVIFRYELNATNVTNYTVQGTYDETLKCLGTWTLTENTTDPTTDDSHFIEYGLKPLKGELGFAHQENGTLRVKNWLCSTPEPVDVGPQSTDAGGFSRAEHCRNQNIAQGHDNQNVDVSPIKQAPDQQRWDTPSAQDPGTHDCVAAGGGAPNSDNIPYTGSVTTELFDGTGERSTMIDANYIGGVFVIEKDDTGPESSPCESDSCELKVTSDAVFHLGGIPAGDWRGWTEKG